MSEVSAERCGSPCKPGFGGIGGVGSEMLFFFLILVILFCFCGDGMGFGKY